jgi:hypothetical protein
VLQRQHWRRVDPHFVHYSRALQQAAMERACMLGGYKAALQLAPPEHRPPACLAGLEVLPADPAVVHRMARLLRLVPVGTLPEEGVLCCANVLSLAAAALDRHLQPSGGGVADAAMAAAAVNAAAQAARQLAGLADVAADVRACSLHVAERCAAVQQQLLRGTAVGPEQEQQEQAAWGAGSADDAGGAVASQREDLSRRQQAAAARQPAVQVWAFTLFLPHLLLFPSTRLHNCHCQTAGMGKQG